MSPTTFSILSHPVPLSWFFSSVSLEEDLIIQQLTDDNHSSSHIEPNSKEKNECLERQYFNRWNLYISDMQSREFLFLSTQNSPSSWMLFSSFSSQTYRKRFFQWCINSSSSCRSKYRTSFSVCITMQNWKVVIYIKTRPWFQLYWSIPVLWKIWRSDHSLEEFTDLSQNFKLNCYQWGNHFCIKLSQEKTLFTWREKKKKKKS